MLREARREDVPLIVAMLADDHLGKAREQLTDMTPYLRALEAIQADPHNWQYVWDDNGEVLGCLQLTIIPGLSQQGSWHAQIEGVRTLGSRRGSGIGKKMMAAIMDIARNKGCKSMQLLTNKSRVDAQRFYRGLGFEHSHEGMKAKL
jgi:ribosomal protein S18 acetylase RimI-like enzyme